MHVYFCCIVKQSVLLISDGTTLATSLATGSEWKLIILVQKSQAGNIWKYSLGGLRTSKLAKKSVPLLFLPTTVTIPLDWEVLLLETVHS